MTSRILPDFDLLVPQNLSESFNHLDRYGEDTSIMAGGTDLLTEMKNSFSGKYVLSLSGIQGLDVLEHDEQKGLRIGAMTTLVDVVKSQVVRREYPALWFSASVNGTVQSRNMGTVVGNVLRASPSGDCCCAVLAYGGTVILQSSEGQREVDIDQFWLDYRSTARKNNEIAVGLVLPPLKSNMRSAFKRLSRTNMDLAKVNAAVCLDMQDSICQNARISIGGVATTPLRLTECESIMQGNEVTEDILRKIEEKVPQSVKPIDDVRSTAEYRRNVSGVLVKRTIVSALNLY